jgi:hypothetical protein
MHIIFENVTSWPVPILRLFKYLKFKVFYLCIVANSDFKKNEIADRLKKKNIFPLPMELEKKILPEASFTLLCDRDSDEITYKRNIKLVPDEILKKYCNLFSLKGEEIKKLRLLLQDIFSKHILRVGILDVWSALYPSKKIIYISFKFMSLYTSHKSSNITKIIIPLDILNFFVKKTIKFFLSFFVTTTNKHNLSSEKRISNNKNFKDFEKQEIAFFPHKGIYYGEPNLFEKSLYYSDNTNSNLNKYNLLHLDYSDYPSPDKNINWVCISAINVSVKKIFFKTLLFSLKTFYLIRNWSTFLGWLLCIQQYSSYVKYLEKIKKFKNLKIALIDYDILCPKTLILALETNNIKTIATQERFLHTFYTSYANVFVDTYYTASKYASNVIKKSKYYDIKNNIPVGQYRSDYILLYKKQTIPKEISKAKESGKKILIALGYHTPKNWFESYTDLILNWSAQIVFLEDIIKLSQSLENIFIVLRYKNLVLTENEYFKKIFDKIYRCENIILCNNYEESFYSYKLCAHADLVIAKATSIADECLANEIPVLFHEYTHNMKKVVSDIPNYLSPELMCYNFEELQQKSESILFSNSSKLREEVKKLNKRIYFVNEKKDIKKKILNDLENQLIENKL